MQLDGRLRAPFLHHWHIEIVDEDNAPFANWRAKYTTTAFIELPINDILRLVGRCLRGERERDGGIQVRREPGSGT